MPVWCLPVWDQMTFSRSLSTTHASILVDGVMKRAHDETTAVGVDDGPNAFVRTFAQADMTHAFLRGIHPLMFDMMISMNMITNEAAAEAALREAGMEGEAAANVMERIGQGHTARAHRPFHQGVPCRQPGRNLSSPSSRWCRRRGKRQIAETSKALVELNYPQKQPATRPRPASAANVDVVMISQTGGVEWYARKA